MASTPYLVPNLNWVFFILLNPQVDDRIEDHTEITYMAAVTLEAARCKLYPVWYVLLADRIVRPLHNRTQRGSVVVPNPEMIYRYVESRIRYRYGLEIVSVLTAVLSAGLL